MPLIARECAARGWGFIVAGDVSSPSDFTLDGCEFLSISRQESLGYRLSTLLPKKHYARKNIGYLHAIASAPAFIVDTDDDNFPRPAFWEERSATPLVRPCRDAGWTNVYAHFSTDLIWPRGFPLDAILTTSRPVLDAPEFIHCPIQQGLADDNPDVDAIYRLTRPLPIIFSQQDAIALIGSSICPTNSQNTTFFPEAYPLLYLPSYCSFRMTDIWRGFVAWRVCAANGLGTAFHSASVYQERNEHDLLRDFELEVPGYLGNGRIVEDLLALEVPAGPDKVPEAMRLCYAAFIKAGLIDGREAALLDAWLADVARLWNGG